jgi:hypothetical protein
MSSGCCSNTDPATDADAAVVAWEVERDEEEEDKPTSSAVGAGDDGNDDDEDDGAEFNRTSVAAPCPPPLPPDHRFVAAHSTSLLTSRKGR